MENRLKTRAKKPVSSPIFRSLSAILTKSLPKNKWKKNLLISSIIVGGILSAQKYEAQIIVKEVQKEFKYKKYSPEILKKFVNQISEIEQKPNVTEFISGEIIGWKNDRSTGTTEEIFG